MRDRYLEVTYRKGRLFAAYLYLPRVADASSVRSEALGDGVVADYDASGALIGLEFTDPRRVTAQTLDVVDRALASAGMSGTVAREELAPLAAA